PRRSTAHCGAASRKSLADGSEPMPRRDPGLTGHGDETAELAGPRGAIWSGTLTFGLVSIPVELYPGVRASTPGLRMLDADGTPLRRRFFCRREEVEVPRDELVHGLELPDGHTIVVTDEELERVEPKKSREIDLRRFVERSALEPLYFERP